MFYKKLYKYLLNKVDHKSVHNIDTNHFIQDCELPYIENPEVGPKNLKVKLQRVKMGGFFEWPNIICLNHTVASFIGNAKRIVNIGSGTGSFESFVAVDKSLTLVASEFDRDCVQWCRQNRQTKNVTYCSLGMKELLDKYGQFDLAICIEVIEHVKNFSQFLSEFSKLSKNAIITTPNKARTQEDLSAAPPQYYQHVREWTAGEFYWILKCYYKTVRLYAMPDIYVPIAKKVSISSTATPLIAICTN